MRSSGESLLNEFNLAVSDQKLDQALGMRLAGDASELLSVEFATGALLDVAAVEVLVALALCDDAIICEFATRKLFGEVIEAICDSFEVSEFYDRLMSVVIDVARKHTNLRDFDEVLAHLGISESDGLMARRRSLSDRQLVDGATIRKAIVLSRVTIGADVAVVSVVLAHIRYRFPDAEIVLVGSERLQELFGGLSGFRVVPFRYGRGAGLGARLSAWLDLLAVLDSEWCDDCYVFDPDSRLTQLGMLPIGPVERDEHRYFFFDGRRSGGDGSSSLSSLSNLWIKGVLGSDRDFLPALWLKPGGVGVGGRVRQLAASPVIAVSLGVGGNERKRLERGLEAGLLELLLDSVSVLLDCGGSEAELREAEEHCLVTERSGVPVVRLKEGSPLPEGPVFERGLIAWQGGIGALASIIGESDGYIGYDSSGQHLAAALGIPLLVYFRNSGSDLFAFRWRPCGPGKVSVVPSNQLSMQDLEVSANEFLRSLST